MSGRPTPPHGSRILVAVCVLAILLAGVLPASAHPCAVAAPTVVVEVTVPSSVLVPARREPAPPSSPRTASRLRGPPVP